MRIDYHRRYSHQLGRDMEFKTYGHAGRPVLVFPTSNGRFYQFEDSGAIGALADRIGAGELQVWTIDGIDGETFFSRRRNHQARIERHEAYFRYVSEEIVPEIIGLGAGRPVLSGCSMGAYHASNFVFRFPDLVAGLVALSGVYSTRHFFHGDLEGAIYYNSPLDYLPGLNDAILLDSIRSRRLFFCCGQGAWEHLMVEDTHHLAAVLQERGIPAWVDFWGHDVSHDWPWWHRQLGYFFGRWLEDDRIDPL